MRQVPDEQRPGRRSPVHATTLAAVHGQEMAQQHQASRLVSRPEGEEERTGGRPCPPRGPP